MLLERKVFEKDGSRFRVIDCDYPNNVYIIGLDGSDREVPKRIDYGTFIDELKAEIVRQTQDPYKNNNRSTLANSSAKEKGEEYFKVLKTYWDSPVQRQRFLEKKSRVQLFKELASELKLSESQTRRLVTSFLRGGMTPNTVIPSYDKRGGLQENGQIKSPTRKRGMSVNSQMRLNFEKAFEKYHRKKHYSIIETYRHLVKDFYPEAIQAEDTNLCPSFWQFYGWVQNNSTRYDEDTAMVEEGDFERNYRILSSYSTSDVNGAGDRFEMDATHLDIYLVSTVNPEIVVGKPILFSVIDVFSSMVVGFSLSFKSESWETASSALCCTVTDKVDFCKNYGIEIDEQDWPAHYLPGRLLCDNGALKTDNITPAAYEYGFTAEYTKPYRADQKGKIERSHRKFNDWIKSHLPGSILGNPAERGAPDYAAKAVLNLTELTKIIILKILEFNNTPISKYPLKPELVAEGIAPTPNELWSWSMQQCRGTLIAVEDMDVFNTLVLPHQERTVHRDGIHIANLVYSSADPVIQQVLYNRLGKKVEIHYDLSDIRQVYLHADNTLYPLTLKDPNTIQNRMTVCELEFFARRNTERINQQKFAALEKWQKSNEEINEIVQNAKKRQSVQDSKVNVEERNREIKRERLDRLGSKEEPEEAPVPDLTRKWDQVRKKMLEKAGVRHEQ